MKNNSMRILLIDVETRPMLSYIWKLFDEQMGTSMLHTDSSILSWSAKWLDEDEVIYADQRNAKNIEDEKAILQKLWKLLDEAHIVVGHNSKKFDIKRINARFIQHGLPPPSTYRQIDTLTIAKKYFAFTSNKLEYLAKALNCKQKKLTKRQFSGFELWKECLAGNKEAWKEMEKYNKQDVLTLQDIYDKLIPWDNSINLNVFHDKEEHICSCGSKDHKKNGFAYTNNSKVQRYKCVICGKESRSKINLLTLEKRKALRK